MAMPVEYRTPRIEDRALEVQLALAGKGRYRAPSIPELIIAATAELAGLTVLHRPWQWTMIKSNGKKPAHVHAMRHFRSRFECDEQGPRGLVQSFMRRASARASRVAVCSSANSSPSVKAF